MYYLRPLTPVLTSLDRDLIMVIVVACAGIPGVTFRSSRGVRADRAAGRTQRCEIQLYYALGHHALPTGEAGSYYPTLVRTASHNSEWVVYRHIYDNSVHVTRLLANQVRPASSHYPSLHSHDSESLVLQGSSATAPSM